MRRRANPVEIGLGIGIMVLAATAPTQIVYASGADRSTWVAALAGGSSAVAALAALGAAYFASRQAAEIGRSRLAEHLLPVLDEIQKVSEEMTDTLGELVDSNPYGPGLTEQERRDRTRDGIMGLINLLWDLGEQRQRLPLRNKLLAATDPDLASMVDRLCRESSMTANYWGLKVRDRGPNHMRETFEELGLRARSMSELCHLVRDGVEQLRVEIVR